MSLFLNAQLDFIFFLYGLAFILLAAVCFAITGLPGRTTCFGMLWVICDWLTAAPNG